jgi:hypothetical protein
MDGNRVNQALGFIEGAQTVDLVTFLGYIVFLALIWDFN